VCVCAVNFVVFACIQSNRAANSIVYQFQSLSADAFSLNFGEMVVMYLN